jgi:hypothetical protein
MSAEDWLQQIPPAASAVGAAAAVIFTGIKTLNWARRRVLSEGSHGFDSARDANKRLFDYLEPRLKEMERRCDECENDKITMRAEFNAEMRMMQAQYIEQITGLKAEVTVLRAALRAAGVPAPPRPLITSTMLEDEPPG